MATKTKTTAKPFTVKTAPATFTDASTAFGRDLGNIVTAEKSRAGANARATLSFLDMLAGTTLGNKPIIGATCFQRTDKGVRTDKRVAFAITPDVLLAHAKGALPKAKVEDLMDAVASLSPETANARTDYATKRATLDALGHAGTIEAAKARDRAVASACGRIVKFAGVLLSLPVEFPRAGMKVSPDGVLWAMHHVPDVTTSDGKKVPGALVARSLTDAYINDRAAKIAAAAGKPKATRDRSGSKTNDKASAVVAGADDNATKTDANGRVLSVTLTAANLAVGGPGRALLADRIEAFAAMLESIGSTPSKRSEREAIAHLARVIDVLATRAKVSPEDRANAVKTKPEPRMVRAPGATA